MRSCHNCQKLSHIKRTMRGDEPVCNYPPRNFNEQTYEYEDVACSCDEYKEVNKKAM